MDREPHAQISHWAARVVAWHNRHPLAQRIAPAQVQGLGYVDLPYSATDVQARRQWRAVFSEDFLPPLRAARIARWALRHGLDQMPRDAGQPVRQVPIDRSRLPSDGLALVLWVGTAAIHDSDGRPQRRVLLGPATPHAVLGGRMWSRPRLAGAVLSLLLLAGLPALTLLHHAPAAEDEAPAMAQAQVQAQVPPAVPPAVAAALAAAAAVASASAAASAPASPPAAPVAVANPVAVPASAAPPAAVPAPLATAVPVPAAPRSAAPFPPRRPVLDEAGKIVAQQDVAAARAARAVAQGHTVYAVATQQVRTQAESERLGATLQAALVNTEAPRGLRVETLPAGSDWRAVCWPFMNRDDAERVREQLALRGQRMEVIAF